MGNTLSGNSVLLFGGQKDIAPHPVVQLGIDSTGQAKPIAVDAIGRPSAALTQSSTPPSSFVIRTATGTVFTLAAGERGFIQNLDTDTLFVKLGEDAAADSLSSILAACPVQDDGKGGYTPINNWIGPVSVFPSTGAARYLAWKI
ncbi:MAG TPA: hypothetical protein VGP24_11805 [Glaciihabitans sp.]|jgi:hypothetical protein|nr:hypothetical protein [Glaciihabitans sp.]